MRSIGLAFNPADDDAFSPTGTDQVGHHGIQMFNNIIGVGSGRTGTNIMFRFGADAADQDYGASFTSGRSQGDWDYNCFYSANGYTDAFRNGATADLFSDLASFVIDMNAVDTSMTGNRSENPVFVDPTYQISDYLVADLGYASVAAAFTTISDAIIAGSIPDALTTSTIAANVLPKYANSLSEANYNNATIGFDPWVAAAAAPDSAPSTTGTRSVRGLRSVRRVR